MGLFSFVTVEWAALWLAEEEVHDSSSLGVLRSFLFGFGLSMETYCLECRSRIPAR